MCVSSASKQPAGLVELEPRVARIEPGGIAVTQVAEEVGFDATFRPYLCLRVLPARRDREEFLVHPSVVEAGHRAAVQYDRTRRENEVRALQAAVPRRGALRHLGGSHSV